MLRPGGATSYMGFPSLSYTVNQTVPNLTGGVPSSIVELLFCSMKHVAARTTQCGRLRGHETMSDSALAFVEYGTREGPPVVALHGGTSTGQIWAAPACEGLPERRWICPDLRGHGATPAGNPPWTFERMARDVVLMMESLGIDEADVIGSSMGARTAVELCRQAPSLVRTAVLVDPPLMTPGEVPSQLKDLTILPRLHHVWPTVDEYVDEYVAEHFGAPVRTPSADLRTHLRHALAATLVETESGGFRLRADRDLLASLGASLSDFSDGPTTFGPPPVFGSFPGEVLLLRAGRFWAVTDDAVAVVQSELGERLRVVTLDTGHLVLWDDFDGAVAAVREFLDAQPEHAR